MRKKAIEKIPFGKEKIHRLDDCFMIDGKLIDRKTNNINISKNKSNKNSV